MTAARQQIARGAARSLRAAADGLGSIPAVVGFDGFIDSIIEVVDQRHAMKPGAHTPMARISDLAARIGAAAGISTNLELIVHEQRFGGNGPLMAGALGQVGMGVTYIGGVGRPDAPRTLHPIYAPLAERCTRVIPVSAPAATDALEFRDGKIMLGKPEPLQGTTWASLGAAIGAARLNRLFGSARLIGIVNWTMMAGVPSIWEGLTRDVLRPLSTAGGNRPRVFIDLCDPAKRTDADVARALVLLRRMNAAAPVTLGLNLAEAVRIDAVAEAGGFKSRSEPTGEAVARAAERIGRATGLNSVVIHPRSGAGGWCDGGSPAWFDGPLVRKPRLSTGAGDHFNAGFALAQTLGLPMEQCLAVGCATSGAYVRDALSPDLGRLTAFLDRLPTPQR